MKNTLLLIGFVVYQFTTYAQGVLWGIASAGGDNAVGTIYRINTNGSGFQAVYSFLPATGGSPEGRLLRATDGLFYGTTRLGGTSDNGVVYRFNPYTGVYQVLHYFTGTDGQKPYRSALMQAADGRIYGTTEMGGANNFGVIFCIDPVTGNFTKLYDFAGVSGKNPRCGLVQAENGKLYGTTYYGGSAYDVGVLYSFDVSDSSYSVLREFNTYYEGSYPVSDLLAVPGGLLYGTLSIGTSGLTSWIFSVDTGGNHFIDRGYLDGTTGLQLLAEPVLAPNGKLYGATNQGGIGGFGTVYALDTSSMGVLCTGLHSFNDTSGRNGRGSVMLAGNGLLYGVTTYGGDHTLTGGYGGGILYRIDTTGANFTVLHVFNAASGYNPWSNLIETENITAVNGAKEEVAVEVFPNPSDGVVTISSEATIYELKVFSVDGRLLQVLPGFEHTAVLPLLSAGTYFLMIQTSKGIAFKRCIVSR